MPYLLTGICACLKCKSPMPGKSATGNGGKVGYYEHVWATKRDSTLTKKIFKCDPHRAPAKKLDPFVLDKFKSLMMDKNMIRQVLESVKTRHQENPHRKDQERLKAKIFGINSQIEALAERLAEIPKSVSAQPIYKQMEKLETIKNDYEDQLAKLRQSGRSSLDRVVDLDKFEDFASHYRRYLVNATVQEQKMMLKKFIKRVEVGVDNVKIHWIVDQEHYERELQLEEVGAQAALGGSSGFFKNYGSYTLTNGAPGRT